MGALQDRLAAAMVAPDLDPELVERCRVRVATCRRLVAVDDLEHAIAWAVGRGASADHQWPLYLALAELYATLGDHARAWRTACAAQAQATLAVSPRGIAIARRLITRVGARGAEP